MVKYIVAFSIVSFYLFVTIRYSLKFSKSNLFPRKVKLLHFVMLWLIPFFWILLLKNLHKTMPGSHEVPQKEDPVPFSKGYMDGV